MGDSPPPEQAGHLTRYVRLHVAQPSKPQQIGHQIVALPAQQPQ